MKRPISFAGTMALAILGLSLAGPAQAHSRRWHEYHDARDDHGHCLRFNKTTGTVAGAVGGGLLGHAIVGGPGGLLVGAAAGGLAGHELSHNRRKHCR
jgi:hypothetical protein